jgi:hypothetical protein
MLNMFIYISSIFRDSYQKILLIIQKKQEQGSNISLLVTFLILVATSIRLVLLMNNWPVTNSDEANMGIIALHIAYHGEWPTMFYGQGYMGPIEAYIAAPIFRLLGSSLLNLRVGLLLFYISFLFAIYYYSSIIYSKIFAAFICLLLCLGSKEVIIRQLKAVGEYPEFPLLAMIICILIVKIVWYDDETNNKILGIKRKTLYFLLGLIVGISIWVDFLILPFVFTGLVILLIFSKKDLLSSPGLFMLAGLLIGLSPFIIYNVTVPFDQSTLANMAGFINASDGKSYSIIQRIAGAFFISIPSATGYVHMCSSNEFPTLGIANVQCTFLQGGWSLGYLVLWTLALWKAIKSIAIERKNLSKTTKEYRQKQIIEYSRLMLLISGGMTIILYSLSTSAASVPDPTARYLIGLLLSIPAVLWQLWPQKNGSSRVNFRGLSRILSFTNVCILLLIFCVFLSGIFETFADVAAAQQYYLQQTNLVQRLQTLGATHIYSEYWTCNRLIFQSDEKIICGVLNEDLSAGLNRYPPYQIAMQKVPNPAYVFPFQSQYDINFIKEQEKNNSLQKYRYIKYAGYSIYIPD